MKNHAKVEDAYSPPGELTTNQDHEHNHHKKFNEEEFEDPRNVSPARSAKNKEDKSRIKHKTNFHGFKSYDRILSPASSHFLSH